MTSSKLSSERVPTEFGFGGLDHSNSPAGVKVVKVTT